MCKIPDYFKSVGMRIAVLMFAMSAILPAVAQETIQEALVVYLKDGSRYAYVLEEKPTVQFNGEQLLIESPQISDTHKMGDVRDVRFEDKTSGVEETPADECRITVTSDEVSVSGLRPGVTVSIYDLQGRTMATTAAADDGVAALSTANIAPGVYVVVASDKHSFKIYKR